MGIRKFECVTDFKVSVVIGAYNAEKFIRKAVSSAEELPEVEEVIVIEDCSTDDTYNLCQQLEKESEKIRLFRHPDKMNRGVAASKNLGVKKAKCELVAFLDADDYYLPNRFEAEKQLFPSNPNVDAVYGALGFHYYSDELKDKYKDHFYGKLTTVTGNVPPDKLKYHLIGMCREDRGYFSLVTLTAKKSLIEKVGYINEDIDYHQDTDFIIKLSLVGNVYPGITGRAIGMRGVHGANRITSPQSNYRSKYLMLKELEDWVTSNIEGEDLAKRFIKKDRMVYQLLGTDRSRWSKFVRMINLFLREPFTYHIEYNFNILIYGILGSRTGEPIVKLKKWLDETLLKNNTRHWDQIIYSSGCD